MRITTKYTYVYRLIGIIGCILVLTSLFMPWVTINGGELQSYQEGATPTGWELANLDKGGAWDENIFAYIFMIMWAFLILPPIGIIFLAIGKDARGLGYYLIVMAIFFVMLILFIMPAIQESIPTPPDPRAEISDDDWANMTADQQTKINEQSFHRNKVLNMKRIQVAPAMGLILSVAGAVVTYIGARLVMRDSERLGDLYNYYVLLVEAHKGSRITKEEEDLLAAQRKMHKVTRGEHEMLLRKMFPDEKDFQIALYSHDHPVDMDRMIIEKSLQDYEVFVAQALGHGEPTKEELQMLEVIRRTLNISMDDHYMVVEYLKAEGRIKEARPAPTKPTKKLVEVPKEVLPAEEATPRYVQSWEYKSTITRDTPLDPEEPTKQLSKTSLVPPPPKWEKPTVAPKNVGDVMGAELKDRPQTPGAQKVSPATSQKQSVGAMPKAPPPGPIVVPRPGAPAPVSKKEEPKAPEPLDDEEVEKEPIKEAPKPAPGPVTATQAGVSAKPKSKRPTKVKCNKCGTTIPVPPSEVPVQIKCPGCGVTGKI